MFLPRPSDMSSVRPSPPPKSSSPAFKFSNGFYAPTMSSSAEKFHSVKSHSPTPRKSTTSTRKSTTSTRKSSSSSSKTPNTRKLSQLEAKIDKLENHLLDRAQEKATHDKILTELSQINATQNKLLGACTRTLPKGLPHYTKVGGKKMRRCPIGSRKKCIKKK
jgi:hypothetical protein